LNHTEFAGKLETYKNTVYRIAYGYLKNKEDAEDVTQEAFLKLYRAGVTFPAPENEKAWLIRITINLCKNVLRANKFRRLLPLEENTAPPVLLETDLETLDLLGTLKPAYRTVMYLFYYERHTTKEIARLLGRNENTIRTWLSRSREQLKEILAEEPETKGGMIYGQQI